MKNDGFDGTLLLKIGTLTIEKLKTLRETYIFVLILRGEYEVEIFKMVSDIKALNSYVLYKKLVKKEYI